MIAKEKLTTLTSRLGDDLLATEPEVLFTGEMNADNFFYCDND